MSNAKLENLSEQEKSAVLEILNQITKTGTSSKLDNILNEDWDEIPVDIHTFLHDKRYLGNALYDNEGRFTIFPYWESKLEEIFPDNVSTRYNTIILTGAIGLGKSTIAVICLLYMLYRLLCLKDPYLYYGLQPIDKISISFMNVTLENARGVALDKLNQMILSSEWFMSHGEMKGISNLEYIPNKHIELIAASSNNQIIGRAIFCLDGDTIISTIDGDKQIKDLENTVTQVYCVNEFGDVVLSEPCEIKQTAKTHNIYEIELEDSTILKCTSNHRFMLKDGSYKEAQYLTELDDLKASHGSIKIKSINRIKLESAIPMYDVINSNPYHNFLVKTDLKYIVSHNCSFEDEVNFSANTTDVEKMKKKMKSIISQVDARMKSRFLRGTYLPTLNIIASSKNSDQSFLDEYINTKKKNESKKTLIVDEPQWVVDSRKDSDIKFQVAIGNKFLANELLPLNSPEALIEEYRSKGYNILDVPIGYYENFADNIDGALTDIAGISTASSLKYISGMRWNEIKSSAYKNPFVKEIIEVGNGKDDFSQYSDFFDLSAVPESLKRKPLFIHLDMSKSGDKTGIAGVYIIGKKPSVEGVDSSKELFYQVAFSVSIKAPKGREISFDKNRTFIRWLRSQGFKICGVSSDTFQSAQIQQQLTADNFNVETISVDRVDRDTRQCLPYSYLKSAIYERRLVIYDNCPFLTEEVLGLERESDGHVEHPEHGTQGCFTGDTKVSLVDGRELTFLELVDEYNIGKENWVYSFNETTKKIEPKRIEKAWCTKKNAQLVEVELDNGEKLRCTPNHRFMLRDGSYKEASELKENDSLMPLYRKYPTEVVSMKGYRMYYEPIEDKWHYEHRQFAKDSEVLDERYLVHHKNCNCKDNTPTNLLWCSKSKHQQIHKELSTGSHSAEAKAKRSNSLSAWYKENPEKAHLKNHKARIAQLGFTEESYAEYKINKQKQLDDRHKRVEARKEKSRLKQLERENHIKSIESLFNVNWDELSNNEKNKYAIKYQRFNSPETVQTVAKAVSENHKLGKYINAKKALQEQNEENKKLKELIPNIDYDEFEKIFGFRYETLPSTKKAPYAVKYRRIVGKTILNHKVINVRFLDYTEDVYDLTIADNHNFALSAGVFVHNSKDSIDAVAGALWNASKHAEEYGYEYGENVELFTEFNSESDTDEIAEFELQLMSRNKAHTEHTKGYEQFGISPPEDFEMGVSEGVFIW